MKLFLGIPLLALLSAFPLQVRAEDPPATGDVVQALRGTQWQGTFSSAGVIKGSIRINFQPELSANGDIRYFHTLVGSSESNEVIGPADKACQYTPRSIHLTPGTEPGTHSGTISVYACADSAADEKRLNDDPKRTASHQVPVSKFSLLPNGQLVIKAKIGAAEVNYQLSRQSLDEGSPGSVERQPEITGGDLGAQPADKQTESAR
jgi:hypothetical protein